MQGRDGTTDAVAYARGLAVTEAQAAGRPDLADDAALVISELVTNALLHGGGCRSVSVRPTDQGLRIEVHDNSFTPPVVGHSSEESLTGRGIRMVSALSSAWGAEPDAEGKVVWAEVTGGQAEIVEMSEDDVLAMWADDWDDLGPEPRHHVELGDVPTDLLLAAKSHVDNVAREFALAATGAASGVTADMPQHLRSLLDAIDRFADARLAIKHQALEAVRRGESTTRLALQLPASAAAAAEEYLHALDEVDAYCRAMRLLTLETPHQHRVFRQWYVGELAAQLRAVAAGRSARPTQTFQHRLLAELDRVAEARRAAERAARLYSVAVALAVADSPSEVASAVLNEGVAALGASGGGILMASDSDRLSLSGAVGYDEEVVARLRSESPDAELPAAYALRTGEPVWLESRAERDARFPDLAGLEAGTVSLCAVPLEVQGRRLGALRFSFTEPRLFDEDERRFVLALAGQTAQALERSRLQRARIDVSLRLQRSLLPPELPAIEGLEVAAIYHPFGDGVDVGGDFYDIWPMADQRWGIAVGDASGTGPEAAALTAAVRYTLRALTMTDLDPEPVMHRLNAALRASMTESDDRFCTAVFGVVSTGGAGVELRLAGGGHPPVFVRRADGGIEQVVLRGSLLGVFDTISVGVGTVALGPGDTLVMLTDGVLEARRDGVLFGVDGVGRVLAGDVLSAQAAVLRLERAVLDHTGGSLADDMAAIALRAQ